VTRRTLLLVTAIGLVPLSIAALLGFEIQRARITARPDYGPVLDLDAAVNGAVESSPTVVWLGDSTASGVGVHQSADALPRQTAALSGLPQNLISLAVSGARVGDVLHKQLPLVPASASVVVIDIGANDVVHAARVATFRGQYLQVLKGLPPHARVVLLGVPDMGSPPRLDEPLRAIVGWRGRQFDAEVRSIARSRHLAYVDIAKATGSAFRHHPKEYFFGDEYHPNVAGYRLWAEAVAPVLAAVLDDLGVVAAQ